jgi:hypothetical protein
VDKQQRTVVGLLFAVFAPILPVSARRAPATDLTVRACQGVDHASAGGKRSSRKGKKSAEQAGSSADACLEVLALSLDVQERLQVFVRKQRWHVSDEEISESLWSFSLDLRNEELAAYAKPDSAPKHVDAKGGKALVLVKTTGLSGGYTRTTVNVHFITFGESQDTFAMKRNSWKLTSNGRLETFLLSALQTRPSADN